MPPLYVINDRHQITATEAAYAAGLCKTFYQSRTPLAAQTAPVLMDQPVLWFVYHVNLKIVDANDRYKQGVFCEIAAPIPNDTGSMPIVQAVQDAGLSFCNLIIPQGLPMQYGLRWRIWGGSVVSTDLVIFRAEYGVGVRV